MESSVRRYFTTSPSVIRPTISPFSTTGICRKRPFVMVASTSSALSSRVQVTSFDVIISDGDHISRIHLNRSYFGLYVGSMVWRSLDNFSSGSVCLVLASAPYEEDDYFRDRESYLRHLKGLAT